MPGKNATEVVIGANGRVLVAPVGTAPPIDSDGPLNAAFVDLGYASEDGASFTVSRDITEIEAWQSLSPLRRVVNSRAATIGIALRQWSRATVTFALGGGTVTASGVAPDIEYKYVPPAPEVIDERALVLEWKDGAKDYRLYFPRGMVTDDVETTIARTEAADLPISFEAMEPAGGGDLFTLFTDDPAFAA